MYNVLSIGELVFFIVGLSIVDWQVADLQDNPLLGPGELGVIKLGGTHTQRIVDRNQWWRLVTSIFYNAGAIHLTGNLGMVWCFGHFLVRELHAGSVAFIYLVSGWAGVVFSANIGSDNATAGASIPAFGLAGAAIMMFVMRHRRYTCWLWTLAVLVLVLGTNVFIGATPFVDNSGNTAGLVFGGILCAAFICIRKKQMETKGGEAVLLLSASLALVVVIAAVIIGLIGLNVDTPAGGCCQKWVCTPSSLWDCDASRIWPTTCSYASGANGTMLVTCPRGGTVNVNPEDPALVNDLLRQQWCSAFCTGAGGDAALAS